MVNICLVGLDVVRVNSILLAIFKRCLPEVYALYFVAVCLTRYHNGDVRLSAVINLDLPRETMAIS